MGFTISEPCHEDWAKMTPSEKGAFCEQCSMEVIDFTDKTPLEIKQLLIHEFSNNSRTCGRITNFQLEQINHENIHWRNEKETFRAIWIVSLLAVFGLSLFSCQNTFSKELITKINMETIALLDQDSIRSDERSLDSLKPSVDTSAVIQFDLPVTVSPYPQIETWMGIMPYYEVNPFYLDTTIWQSCNFVLGSVIVTGNMTHEAILLPKSKQKTNKKRISSAIDHGPNAPKQPLPTSDSEQRINGYLGSSSKQFDGFVHPNPILSASQLYLQVHEPIKLSIAIFKENALEAFRAGTIDLSVGNFTIDPKLYALEIGNYQLELLSIYQRTLIDFIVDEKLAI